MIIVLAVTAVALTTAAWWVGERARSETEAENVRLRGELRAVRSREWEHRPRPLPEWAATPAPIALPPVTRPGPSDDVLHARVRLGVLTGWPYPSAPEPQVVAA